MSNRDSVFESDAASSVMMREESAYDSRMGSSQLDTPMQARIVDNTRLSALTNQIMELVIDNIRMVHMNSKLLDYCKRQILQSESNIKKMES